MINEDIGVTYISFENLARRLTSIFADRVLAAASAKGLSTMAPIFSPDPIEARRKRDDWQARGASMFIIGTSLPWASTASSARAMPLAEPTRDC